MEKMEMRSVDWFKFDPKQPRKQFNEAELRELGESMRLHGQWQAVVASPDGIVRIGERRVRAAHLVGMKELRVIITDKAISESELRLIQLTENIQRQDLTAYELWMTCAELMCMNPGWQMKDLADHLKKDASTVTRILSPSKCIPAWQEALKGGKVGISDCYAASKLPETEQAGLLSLKLSGASRDAIEQAGRKKRNGDKPTVKTARIRIPLAINTDEVSINGTATVAGLPNEDISLEDAENILKEALRAVRDAIKQGLNSKTAQDVFRDKAKAG